MLKAATATFNIQGVQAILPSSQSWSMDVEPNHKAVRFVTPEMTYVIGHQDTMTLDSPDYQIVILFVEKRRPNKPIKQLKPPELKQSPAPPPEEPSEVSATVMRLSNAYRALNRVAA